MKCTIKILLPITFFWSVSVGGQVTKVNTTIDKLEVCSDNSPCANEEVKWKEDNVAERKSFYTAQRTFDPAEDYSSQYIKNAASGSSPKIETGKVKVMTDNNMAPIVYYNNAIVGTILKLNNPDNGKTTYAVVVGKVSPIDSQSYLIVLNERAARNISIKDYSSIELICYTEAVH